MTRKALTWTVCGIGLVLILYLVFQSPSGTVFAQISPLPTYTPTPVPAGDLWITINVPGEVLIGATFQYPVTVDNPGGVAAEGVVVENTLPDGVSFVATDGCDNDPDGLSCTLGTIAAGSSRTYTVTVTAPPVEGVIILSAQVDSTTFDPNRSNNFASASTTVVAAPRADLQITMDLPVQVQIGAPWSYQVRVDNRGPWAAEGVVVENTLPDGVSFVATDGCDNDPDGLSCTLGTIASWTSRLFVVNVTAPAVEGGIIVSAQVDSATPDPVTFNNSAIASTPPGIIVNSTADNLIAGDGLCTLREAINSANHNLAYGDCLAADRSNTIVLFPETYWLTIPVPPDMPDDVRIGDLDIEDHLTIVGAGAANTHVTVDPNSAFNDSLFSVGGNADVSFKWLTISGGRGHGIEVHNESSVALTGVTVSGNDGSGITRGTWGDNVSVSLVNSTVSGNYGSGIAAANVSLRNSTVSNNGSHGIFEGVICQVVGCGDLPADNVSLVNSTVSGNDGHGIYGRSVSVGASTVSGNDGYGIRVVGGGDVYHSTVSGNGGGIYVDGAGTFRVSHTTIDGNSASTEGGGIRHTGGRLKVNRSTISNNSAETAGGGISATGNASISIVNSTISGNRACWTPALSVDGSGSANLEITNSTLAYNETFDRFPCSGSHMSVLGTEYFLLRNSILAGNAGAQCSDALLITTGGAPNLASDGTCSVFGISQGDADLGPLQDNGGATFTHALGANSAALNAGDDAICSGFDQRGVARPQGAACDLGAFELENVPPTLRIDSVSVAVDEGGSATNGGGLSDPDGHAVTLSASVGSVTDNGDGTWSWTYPADDGPDQMAVTITADDTLGGSAHVTFDLTVNNVAPSVTAPADRAADEGTAAAFPLGAFADPGADGPWQVTVDWGDSYSDTTLMTTPGALEGRFHTYADDGAYTVTVSVAEESGAGASGSASFLVTVANLAPTALNDTGIVGEDGPALTIDVLANDSDPAGAADPLTVSGVDTTGTAGMVSFSPAGVTYDPNGGFEVLALGESANDSFGYGIADGDGGTANGTVIVLVNGQNDWPSVAVNNGTVTVDEGQTAANSGTFADVDGSDNVTVNTTAGAIVQDVGNSGAWSWSFDATDGPEDGQTVTLIVNDSNGALLTDTFKLVVNNVPPTAGFENSSGELIAGETATLAFSNPFDPGIPDTTAGFLYSFDCTDDGTFELSDAASPSFDCDYPNSGSFTARGRIEDKDGGYTDYMVVITVLTPAEAIVDLVDTVENLNLQQGIENGLDAKLDAAVQALNDLNENNTIAAINSLEAFINAVEAQRGKQITDEQADMLISEVQRIIDSVATS